MELDRALKSGRKIVIAAKKFYLDEGHEQVTRPLNRQGFARSFYNDPPFADYIRRA